MRGLLIAICGLDGSGKTTQINMINNWFNKMEKPILMTRQPTNFYREDLRVREYLDHGKCPDMDILAMLAAADRRWQMATEIEPALEKGESVVTDRYLYSSLAYFSARGLNPNYIKMLNGDIRVPDVTLFLDINPELTLKRIASRDGGITKYEERDLTIFNKVRKAFKEVLPPNVLMVDATLDPLEIHNRVLEKIEGSFFNLNKEKINV